MLAASTSRTQQTPSTFKAATDLVQVDVSVLDSQRQPVRGLNAKDFTILEDDHPRPVAAFTAVNVPSRATSAAAWLNGSTTNLATNSLPTEGRLIVILLDRTINDGFQTITARKIAKAIVAEMGPADLATVVFSHAGRPQNFTNDHARLNSAIDGSNPGGEIAAETGLPDPDPVNFSAECYCGTCVHRTIANIADAVRDADGRRKLLFFITRNIQIETTNRLCMFPLRDAREAMFKSLDLASLTVHALDPTGLDPPAEFQGASQQGAYDGRSNVRRWANVGTLSDRTGGRTVVNTNAPELRVPEIIAETGSYYLLGFEPTMKDGQRHDISVKVDRPNVRVSTRHQFLAAASGAAAVASARTANDAIAAALPVRDGISLTAQASAFRDPASNDPVLALAVHAGHGAAVAATADNAPEEIEIVTTLFADGRSAAVGTLKQTLQVTPSIAGSAMTFDLLQRLAVKPGHYEVRIGIRNAARNQTGSVFALVDVPAYDERLVVSDLMLHMPMVEPAAIDSTRDLLVAPATARRELDRNDPAAVFVRCYQGRPPADLVITTRVIDSRERERFGTSSTVRSDEFVASGSADHLVMLPTADLEAGVYLLKMTIVGGSVALERQLRFTVK
jgi:VWFA-related protein